MIIWIGRTLVLAIHDRQLAEHGGISGVRDEGLLDSTLARPQQLQAYGDPPPDLADLAASLAFGLARNHPFGDGNKRTAHVAYRTFLLLNGAEMHASDEDKYVAMVALLYGAAIVCISLYRITREDHDAALRELAAARAAAPGE